MLLSVFVSQECLEPYKLTESWEWAK